MMTGCAAPTPAYLDMTDAFAPLRPLPMSDRDEGTEILALRHQITVLERQPGQTRPRFSPGDRAFLAALLHRVPVGTLRRLRLPVRPEAVLRRHRDLLARRHAAGSRPERPGRPRTIRSTRLLVPRLAHGNPARGYRRIPGELLVLGTTVAASTVRQILEDAGSTARFLILDRDGKSPALFDAVLADAGTQVVLSGVRVPRMNAITGRRIHGCRRELPDRTLIWNQPHLLRALREYERFHNTHRPHQGIANARPLHAPPQPATDRAAVTRLDIRRRQRPGGIPNEYHHASRPARTTFSASTSTAPGRDRKTSTSGHHRNMCP
jgi:hypothetical protein